MRDSTWVLIVIYAAIAFVIVDVFTQYFWLVFPIGLIFAILYIYLKPYLRRREIEIRRERAVTKERIAEEKKEWQTKSIILVVVGLISAVVFWFLPAWVNTICYFVPLILLSIVITKDGEVFNFTIFFVGLVIFLIVPSFFGQSLSAMRLDAAPPLFNLDASEPAFELPNISDITSGWNDMGAATDLRTFAQALKTFIDALRIFAFVAMPVIMSGLCAWVFFKDPAKFPSMLLKTVVTVALIALFSVMFPGKILSFQGLDTWGVGGVVQTMTNQIFSLMPFLMSMITVTVGYVSRYDSFAVIMASRDERAEKKWEVRTGEIHWGLFALILIIVLWAFARFLMSTDGVGFGNPGILSLYIMITIAVSIPVLIGRLTIINEGTYSSNFTGAAIGIGALLLAQQAISTAAYNADMVAFSLDATGGLWGTAFISLGDTILFTAMTESMLFHIAIPAFVMMMLYRRTRSADQREVDAKLRHRIRELQLDIQRKETILDILQNKRRLTSEIVEVAAFLPEVKRDVDELQKIKESKRSIAKRSAYLRKEIQTINEDIEKIKEYLGKHAKVSWGRMVFGKWSHVAIFIVIGVVIPNIAFAFFHWFRSGGYDAFGNLNPPIPVYLWVSEGPFTVFVISGMILTLVGLKYGWYSAIITHGGWNAMLIVLSAIQVGGLG